ncbi:ABC transporter substrate-binding protein [Actinospica sp. MGRD01-02]|uniref:ABC transporter substrate-binding protein n=1 Tax=Actinospica acidithermotolerans TaxID=2828514 RepID=A0A941IH66_9ACTN|nr:ABC transporter substrate-binding protein [Actinospica acidithermotolerans]MBR7828195.1 ABC transporter substrate-binding protein [Actinospica acidithermotolerans]
MLKKTTIGAVTASLMLAGGLTACSSSSSSNSGGSGSGSSSLPTVTMMVGGIDKQIYLPYELAQQLGYYKKYGVNMVLSTETQGGIGAEDAMASGQVDLAGAWYIHTIDFQTKGKSVVSLAQLSGAPGEREMCATNSGIHSPSQWSGKTLGVTDLGSGTDELTQLMATKAGLTTHQYSRIGVSDGATAIAALQTGKVQCLMTTQPTVLQIEQKGLGYSAMDLATSSGITATLGGTWPAAGVLTTTAWVSAHQTEAQDVVDALVATMHWIANHSAADIANALPASYTSSNGFTKAEYITALTQDKGQFLPDGIMPKGGPETILATEKTIGVNTSSVNLDATFTNKYAEAANKLEGFTTTTTPEPNSSN